MLLKECVAMKSQVHKRSVWYGKKLPLTYAEGVKVPIDWQKRSVVVKGSVRVTSDGACSEEEPQASHICAIKVRVNLVLHVGSAEGQLNN